MTPFRSEKDTNWEGAFRIPLIVRWPKQIKAGSISNEIVQHHDWLPNVSGDGRRSRRERETQERPPGDRPDLPEPHRRREPSNSFTIDDAIKKLSEPSGR
jgi:arylsulfatase A-like enzyme